MHGQRISSEKGAVVGNCDRLTGIAMDFQPMVRSHCPRCNNLGDQCLVETIHDEFLDQDGDAGRATGS